MNDLRSRRLQPSAERYFLFLFSFVFALCERKNEKDRSKSTMLPQAKQIVWATA